MKHRILSALSVIGLLLAAMACTAEVELVEGGSTGGLPLRPGEREFSIRLNGIMGVSGVPATRAAELVTVEGENEIQSITIYGMVGLYTNSKEVPVDGYSPSNPTNIYKYYTLERVYRYIPGSSDNDILLVADGSGYKLTLGVQNDSYRRAFLVAVNTKEETNGSSATAPSVAVPVYTNAATPALSDRTLASTGEQICELQSGVRVESGSLSVTSPLAMGGLAYFPIQSINGEVGKSYFFSQEYFDRGMSVDLMRSVGRFDVRLPDYVKLLGLSDGTVQYWVDAPFEKPVNGEINAPWGHSYSVKLGGPNTIVAVNNMVSGAFYLPAGSINGTVKLKVEYLGKEVELVVFESKEGSTWTIKPNTRYIINVINSGANNLSTSLRMVEWNDGEDEMEGGDVYGTLNAGATMSLEVTDMMYNDDAGEEIETPLPPEQASLFGELNPDTKKITVAYFYSDRPFPSPLSLAIYVKLTGKSGTNKPIGIIDSDGWLDWTRKVEDFSTGTYTVKLPVMIDNTTPIFTPPRTSVLKVVTHPDGGKEKYDEYIVEREWAMPTKLASPTTNDFPEVTITTPNDKWSVVGNTITLPAMAGYKELVLVNTGKYSGWITEGVGDWLKTSFTPGLYDGGTTFITPTDNFKSDKERASELVLREYKNGALTTTKYKIIQSGGKFNAALLTNKGFDVNVSNTWNGGLWIEGVQYNNKTLTCLHKPASNPGAYNISIHSNDSDPIFVEIIKGGAWMSLESEIAREDGSTNGLYAVGLRISDPDIGIDRSGKISVSYRDAVTDALRTEIINVIQKKEDASQN